MKKIILTVLLLFGVGSIQTENILFDLKVKQIFVESNKSLEDIQSKIKETAEYKKIKVLDFERAINSQQVVVFRAKCEWFKENGESWFWRVEESHCSLAQEYEKKLVEKNKAFVDANNELEALIAKDYPKLRETCLSILERQKTIDLLNKLA